MKHFKRLEQVYLGVLATAIFAISFPVLADYKVKVTNATPFYVDVQLLAKGVGQANYQECVDTRYFQIFAGQSTTATCPSNADNWRRKFTISEGDYYEYGIDCILVLSEKRCVDLHGIKSFKFASGNTVQYPRNGGWFDKWIIRDKGRYSLTIPKNYCGNIFRPNNHLITNRSLVDTDEERAQIIETLACAGLNRLGERVPHEKRMVPKRIKDGPRIKPAMKKPQ